MVFMLPLSDMIETSTECQFADVISYISLFTNNNF